MARRWFPLVPLFLIVIPLAPAKDKKEILPAYVLQAKTVLVVIDPDAGVSPSNPNENRTAQEDVEKALMNWGRFSPTLDLIDADLVISVRRGNGKAVNNTIGGAPNNRPVIIEPIDSGIRLGAQQGTNTPVTSDSPPPGSHPQTEVGPTEDTFILYRGKVKDPLDNPPVWRYAAKDALSSPSVPAVAQFQKVIEQTEKELVQQQQQQKQKKP
jgi:hypothetical protein